MKKLFILLSLITFAAACGSQGPNQQAALPKYKCVELDTSSAVIYVEYAAELRGEVMVDIRPRVSGYLDKICVEEGSSVTKGQPLFIVDQRDLEQQFRAAEAQVDASKAQVANAELEVRKLTPLVEKGIVAQFELETAKSNLIAAKANQSYAISQRNNAQINLSYATITAPVDGVVGRIVVRQGTLVSPSSPDPLTTVSADKNVDAYFSIDERSMLDVAQNIKGASLKEKIAKMPTVNLILANGQLYEKPGRLELASGQVDMTTGSVQVKANFPNPEKLIRSGSSGRVRLNNPVHGIIKVPQKATFETLDRKMVYVITDSSTITAKPIQVDGIVGDAYIVSQGVSKGDEILLEGLDFVREGMKIEPIFEK